MFGLDMLGQTHAGGGGTQDIPVPQQTYRVREPFILRQKSLPTHYLAERMSVGGGELQNKPKKCMFFI